MKTSLRGNKCLMPSRVSSLGTDVQCLYVPQTYSPILQLKRIFKVTKLWSPDGGNEASTTRRSNANPDSLSTMDKNAVNMTMENSQLKKLLAEVGLILMSNTMLRNWPIKLGCSRLQ